MLRYFFALRVWKQPRVESWLIKFVNPRWQIALINGLITYIPDFVPQFWGRGKISGN
jgi:hypothetical protein